MTKSLSIDSLACELIMGVIGRSRVLTHNQEGKQETLSLNLTFHAQAPQMGPQTTIYDLLWHQSPQIGIWAL